MGPSGGADRGQGRRADLASEIESVVTTSESPGEKRAVSEAGRVFLVHGHNELGSISWDGLFAHS